MLLKIFAVYDTKVGAFLPPFIMRTQAEAERAIESAVNKMDHDFNRYAADYNFSRLGVIDDTTGIITPELNGPHSLGSLQQFLYEAPTAKDFAAGFRREPFAMPNAEMQDFIERTEKAVADGTYDSELKEQG